MTLTFEQALSRIGVSIPAHLIADAEVPILDTPQPQGDLLIMPNHLDPFDAESVDLGPLPDEGIQVVTSEATGNTHWLHRGFDSPDVMWGRVTGSELVEVVRRT